MLVLICLVLQVAGFYVLYNSSVRMTTRRSKPGLWLLRHRKTANIAGWLMLLGSVMILAIYFSLATSVVVALTSVMTVFSVLIIGVPLFKQ